MSFDLQRDGWNEWTGKEAMPLYPRVQVLLRCGAEAIDEPDEFTWDIDGSNDDIVAWKPVEAVEAVNPLDVQVGGGHYKKYAIQPVEFITKNKLGFLEGCVIKRICRYEDKNGREDLEKIKHEIDLLIELKYGPAS